MPSLSYKIIWISFIDLKGKIKRMQTLALPASLTPLSCNGNENHKRTSNYLNLKKVGQSSPLKMDILKNIKLTYTNNAHNALHKSNKLGLKHHSTWSKQQH